MRPARRKRKGGKSLADIPNATAADSLIYYFGQMRGAEYQREAERDTTLDTDQAKKAYVQGVQAGLNAAKANDEAYNRGLFLGMQMAMNMQQFKDEYDVQLNKKVFVESLSDAISADSVQDAREMQKEFYRIMGSFNEQKEKRDKEAADAALTQEAAKLKLAKISEVLYGEVTAKNDSAKIKTGDNVVMEIKLSNAGGKGDRGPASFKRESRRTQYHGSSQRRTHSPEDRRNRQIRDIRTGIVRTEMPAARHEACRCSGLHDESLGSSLR